MTKRIIVFAGDVAALLLSFVGTMLIGFGHLDSDIVATHLWPFLLLYGVWLIILYIFNFYDLATARPTVTNVKRFLGAIGAAAIIGVAFFYLLPLFDITPKTNLAINLVLFGLLLFAWRRLFFQMAQTYMQRRLLLVGTGTHIATLRRIVRDTPQLGYFPVGVVSSLAEARARIASDSIDAVIIGTDEHTFSDGELTDLYTHGVEVLSVPHAYELLCERIPVDTIDLSWFLHHVPQREEGIYHTLSRFIEILVSSLVLLIFSPLMALIALAIYLSDRGPVFYTHDRVGKYGKPFVLYKFRSMVVDAEKHTGATWAQANDPRVTRVGRIIRTLHVDELPQMWNVLRGDMALVGPRPERPSLVAELSDAIPHYALRHIVAPGFTGWAQIKYRYARSTDDSQEKFEYDLYYIKNKSLWLDIGIIVKTVQIIVTH